jgi:predicted extracellular nuclease
MPQIHTLLSRYPGRVGLIVLLASLMMVGGVVAQTTTDPVINEYVANHTGSDTHEFVEILGDANTDYSALTLLEIEGDGSGTGVVDGVFPLGTTDADGYWTTGFRNNEIENGSITLLLVEDFTGSAGADLDTDNDGVLDTVPWTRVVDGLSIPDGGASDGAYASLVLARDFDGGTFTVGGASRIPNGVNTGTVADWTRNEYDGFGLPGFAGSPALGEAINTPGTSNRVYDGPQAGPNDVIITEIMQNPSAVSDGLGEWVELYNVTTADIDINGWVLADNDFDRHVIDNGGNPLIIPAGGYLVLGNNADTATNGGVTVGYEFSGYTLSNSADEVVLLNTADLLIDQVEYDNGVTFPDPNGASMALSDVTLDNNDGANWCESTTPFGAGDAGTPGSENDCGGGTGSEFGVCGDPATFIHEVQGAGTFSPLAGTNGVVVEAVVVGDFQDTVTELRGFFLQEEDLDADGDSTTSEGLFIYDNGFGVDVTVGDVVRVRGDVTEYNDLTEMNNVTDLVVCAAGSIPSPAIIGLPVTDLAIWEQVEGMQITVPQILYVTETYNQGRYGEVGLSVVDRLYNPTNEVAPGTDANALQDLNDRSRLLLDDGSTRQNPLPLPPYLGADGTLRGGDTLSELTGVVTYGFGEYRVHPTQPVTFTRVNARTATPAPVGGTLTVASFNVLNYFNGDGAGGGFPTSRGADTLDEFNRQRAKIISAILAMDADVIGLMEIENDGYGAASAIQDLVDGLNAVAGAGTYAFVNPGVNAIGTDAIAVGLIYQPASVTPHGTAAILDSTVDPLFVDTKNRPVLAQTFVDNGSGALFTVAVNHLKSKGSDCDALGDPDVGDGQGNCNVTRTNAATALANWLATDPTGSDDPDFLIIGDLNAYAMEDPITVLKNAGYTDMIELFVGEDAYSYVFDGQAGYLDHALANASLLEHVTGVSEWHINADEPRAFDYNDFNQPDLYAPDPYRASDHDPVLIGLEFDIELTIDILPSQSDNRINLNSHRRIPVVVYSTEGFDATTIDPETVTLAGAPVARRGWWRLWASRMDVNRDGQRDLVLRFNIQDLDLTPDTTEAELIGQTTSGQSVVGSDSIWVGPPWNGEDCWKDAAYWLAHGNPGHADFDEAWLVVGPQGMYETFLWNMTYADILRGPNSGWYKLGKIYITLYLNIESGETEASYLEPTLQFAHRLLGSNNPHRQLRYYNRVLFSQLTEILERNSHNTWGSVCP